MKITKEKIDIKRLDHSSRDVLAKEMWDIAKDYVIGWDFKRFKDHYIDCNEEEAGENVVNKALIYRHDKKLTSFVALQFVKFIMEGKTIYVSRLYAVVDPKDRGDLSTISMAVIEWIKFYFFKYPFSTVYFIDTLYHPVVYSQIKNLSPVVWVGREIFEKEEIKDFVHKYCEREGIVTSDGFITINQGDYVQYREADFEDFRRLHNRHIQYYFDTVKDKQGGLLICFPINSKLVLYGFPRYLWIKVNQWIKRVVK